MRNRIIISILFLSLSCKSQSETENNNLVFPENIVLSGTFSEQIKEQKNEFYRIFRKDTTRIKSYSTEFILDKIDNSKEYQYIFESEYWLAFNYKKMIPELIKRITNNREIGLINTADLIIWERIESGDLKFYGHGGVAFDDLFKISGRANHLLKNITGEDFGNVMMNTSQKELTELQNKWIEWLSKI
ncbi:hypothetical protein FIA58_010560 [Flavobacterium jejuense]|uniref:DUF4136 domain-containing protein n=1 Tax=Flavobacterium jejuense TaxID=1544455 RepID=A0ABX0IRG0_9FLAO|nr:hypothetical protein [Flavobacterium jejuense]NHN26118.1 hypothetical protein [Flavobacterium jejuense]